MSMDPTTVAALLLLLFYRSGASRRRSQTWSRPIGVFPDSWSSLITAIQVATIALIKQGSDDKPVLRITGDRALVITP
jgi:hypothetical protein